MELFEWDDVFSVGVAEIDNQHKYLFEIINESVVLMDNNAEPEQFLQLAWHLKDYALMHFETEERYMRQCDYPDLDSHMEVHRDFCESVVEFLSHGAHPSLGREIFQFVYDWLQEHILGSDKAYAPFISACRT